MLFLIYADKLLTTGKDVLYNIVAFAKESVKAHVTTLGPENFPKHEKEPWLVDFFAPVSCSCQKL